MNTTVQIQGGLGDRTSTRLSSDLQST